MLVLIGQCIYRRVLYATVRRPPSLTIVDGKIVGTTRIKARLLPFSLPPSVPPSLQEAAKTLSHAASVDVSDTDAPYNAACAFALFRDDTSCFRAMTEYCRRLAMAATRGGGAGGAGGGMKEVARRSLREAASDGDLEGVRGLGWFLELVARTDAALL